MTRTPLTTEEILQIAHQYGRVARAADLEAELLAVHPHVVSVSFSLGSEYDDNGGSYETIDSATFTTQDGDHTDSFSRYDLPDSADESAADDLSAEDLEEFADPTDTVTIASLREVQATVLPPVYL